MPTPTNNCQIPAERRSKSGTGTEHEIFSNKIFVPVVLQQVDQYVSRPDLPQQQYF